LKLSSIARRYPVAAFVVLTLLWSWGVWSLLFLLGGQGTLLRNPPPLAYALAAIGGCGPTLIGMLLTGWIDGRAGLAALGLRLRQVRLGRWWLALLFIPCVSALTPVLRSITGHPQDGQAMLGLIMPGLALGLGAGLMEEFGWRGFLLPRLLKRHSPIVASLLVGLIWGGLWHGYADYFGISGEGWQLWLLMLLLGPGLLTAWSLVLTTVYMRTQGSLLMSLLMHASISSSALILGQRYTGRAEELGWTALSVALALIAAALMNRRLQPAVIETRSDT
jgi:uncharacterized protein